MGQYYGGNMCFLFKKTTIFLHISLQRNTTEYQDACELWELFEETKGVLLAGVFGQQPASVAASDDTLVYFVLVSWQDEFV